MDNATLAELLKAFAGAVIGGTAAYAAVREKMGELIARINNLEKRHDENRSTVERAHHRIDEHHERFHSK